MAKKDYYDVLGVEKNCDDKSLKSAFRKLAKEYHPDHNAGNPESEAKFKEISEANERQKTPETRDTSKPKNIDSGISSIYDGETTPFLEDGLPSQIDFPAGISTLSLIHI